MPRKSCLLCALAFALLLTASPAVAASGPGAPVALSGSGLLQQAWGWIVSVWGQARCGIDPDGGDVACAPLVAEPKLRGCINPDGGDVACAPAGGNGPASPSTYFMKLGPCIDPDGRMVCAQ